MATTMRRRSGGIVVSDWDLIEEWITDRRRRGYRPSTIKTGRREVTLLARHLDGRLLGADHRQISAWLDARGITHPESRRCYLSHLSAFYEWAVLEEHATTNPVRRIARPRHRRRLPRPIPRNDLDVVLDNASPEKRALLLCALLAGLRCQEIAGLDREDLLDQHDPPMMFITEGKGGHERTVPMHPALWAALRLHGLPRSGPVFLNQFGHRRTPASVSQMICRHFRRCGIDGVAHRLRHTFGSETMAACHDLRVVQELLGHQSPKTTAIYTAWSSRTAWEAVQGLRGGGTIVTRSEKPVAESDR